LGGAVGNTLEITGLGKLKGFPAELDQIVFILVFIALGLIGVSWIVLKIIRPALTDETFGRITLRHPIFAIWNEMPRFVADPNAEIIEDFPTTHPSYVLIDFLSLSLALLFFWIGNSNEGHSLTTGSPFTIGHDFTLVIVAAFFPIVRLVCWYGLGIRPKAKARYTWQPIVMLYVVLALLILPVVILSLKK
jgi:hypothetical protein